MKVILVSANRLKFKTITVCLLPPRVSGCSVVPWFTASSGIWKGARLPSPCYLRDPYLDSSTPACWTLWGTAASRRIPPHQDQGGRREAEAEEGEEEGEEELTVGEEKQRIWTTDLLSLWVKRRRIGSGRNMITYETLTRDQIWNAQGILQCYFQMENNAF